MVSNGTDIFDRKRPQHDSRKPGQSEPKRVAMKIYVSEGREDPSPIQSYLWAWSFGGVSTHVTKTLGRVGLCDKDRVLDLVRCLRDVGGFRAKDAQRVA